MHYIYVYIMLTIGYYPSMGNDPPVGNGPNNAFAIPCYALLFVG